MPVIEITGSPNDPGWVKAIMLFPNDKETRDYWYAANIARLETSDLPSNTKIEVDVQTIRLLLEAPSWRELKRLTAEATKRAIYAGDILAAIYLMDRFKDAHEKFARPSLGKAIHVLKEFGVKGKFGDGDKMPYSAQKIRDCWDEFKPVAHLWAAFRINFAYEFTTEPAGAFGSPAEFQIFLEVAAGMFKFGTTFVPKAAKPAIAIMDAETAWRIPESFQPRNLISDRLPDGLVQFLKSYKAN